MRSRIEVGWKLAGALVLPFVLGWLPASAEAQTAPQDLNAREKTEVFIQHLVKVAKIDPSRYQALVLEYEIASALSELTVEGESGEKKGDEKCCAAGGPLLTDFIDRALREIHPEYARVAQLRESGNVEQALEAARALESGSDPYLAAHARLILAEMALEAAAKNGGGDAFEKVISLCERLGQNDRLYLIKDYRACELIALSFEKLKKPLLELVQYAILLTDYNELPSEVEARAKARLAALDQDFGRPLTTVSTWMGKVEKLLSQELTGKDPTQKEETEIVSALDKLIELEEARERKT